MTTPWAKDYHIRFSLRKRKKTRCSYEFYTFRWNLAHFTNSKKEMVHYFSPLNGLLRHILSMEWDILSDIYTTAFDESPPNLQIAERTIYEMLWMQPNWNVYVQEVTNEIANKNTTPYDEWHRAFTQPPIFLRICKHLKYTSIINFKQTSKTMNRLYNICNPFKIKLDPF